ncbi:hypothetical protein [Eubacterium oxidoreducens]|nr:hypothetical protein [Eubacterium oxidoreducens]
MKNMSNNKMKNKNGRRFWQILIAIVAILNLVCLFAFDYQIPGIG